MSRIVRSLVLASGLVAALTVEALQYTTELPVRLGEWNWNFEEAKEIADSRQIPMVLFWAGSSCTVCQAVEAALDDPEVLAWQAERRLVMVFQAGTTGPMKDLAKNASGTYPYFCVYWNRGAETSTNKFSGVVSGPSHWPATGKTIGENFIKSVELYIKDYQPMAGNSGEFACGDRPGNRLEIAEGRTTRLGVPLRRAPSSTAFAATNLLVSVFPARLHLPPSTNVVEWAEDQSEALPQIDLPDGLGLAESVSLALFNSDGLLVDERTAVVVGDPGNCPSNPDWLGDPFAFGRWTFDYGTVTNEVAATNAAGGSAHALVLFTGALWCPYCKGIESSLLRPGSPFYGWAAANNVALAEFDQGRASSPATAEGTRAPRLLTYEPDPKLATNETVSGSGYLSRHMIGRPPAEAVLASTTDHTKKWLAPESTSARLSQPTILLVRDDRVIARYNAYRTDARVYEDAENMARLADFLKLEAKDGELDSYRTTTRLRHAAGGEGAAELQISDRIRFYALDNLAAGSFSVTRTDGGTSSVAFSLMQGTKTLASGTDELETSLSRATVEAGGLFLKVEAYKGAGKIFAGTGLETSVFTLTFGSAQVLEPEEGTVRYTPAQPTVAMAFESGVSYRLVGFTAESLAAAGLEPLVGGVADIYVASEDGTRELSVANAGSAVEYQLWVPGEFAFADPSPVTIREAQVMVDIAVVRRDGSSGATSARVKVDASAVSVGRFAVGVYDESGAFVEQSEPVLAWEDGEDGEKVFVLRIDDGIVCEGDETLVFGLETVSGAAVVSEEDGRKDVTIADDDRPGPGRLAITDIAPSPVRDLQLVAVAGGKVNFEVSRLEGADGEIGATFAVSVGGVLTEGLLEPAVLSWPDKGRGEDLVRRATLTVPADAVGKTITVRLTPTGGAKADALRRSFSVSVISPDAPAFAYETATWPALSKATVSETVAVRNTAGGDVTVVKVSGSLPDGVTARYDAAAGALTFAGQPARAGTFTATYQVFETREGVRLAGDTFTAVFTVEDLATAFPVFAGKTGVSRTFKDVYFIESETKRVTGVLTLTIPASGRLSAKYRCAAGDLSFSATGWTWNPEESGVIRANLTNRKPDYDGYFVELEQQASGKLVVQVHDMRFPAALLSRTLDASDVWSAERPATSWRGQYTLAFPVLDYKMAADSDLAYLAAAAGCPTFTLKMTAKGAINAGRFTWTGYLPNGRGVSGSSVVSRDGTAVLIPFFCRNASELLSALVTLRGGAADEFAEEAGGPYGFGLRAITPASAALNWWEHTDAHTDDLSFGWTYAAYGSYYDPDLDFESLIVKSGVSPQVTFVADMTEAPASPVHGAVTAAVREPVAVTPAGPVSESRDLRLQFNRKTGVISGAVQIPFETGDVRANYRGVVLPGWTGCGCHDEDLDLPFFFGAAWFADKVDHTDIELGKTTRLGVKRGCAVTGETHVDL